MDVCGLEDACDKDQNTKIVKRKLYFQLSCPTLFARFPVEVIYIRGLQEHTARVRTVRVDGLRGIRGTARQI